MIRFGFAGEHPDYHSYEAVQIFSDAGIIPEFVPGCDEMWLESVADDGAVISRVTVPMTDDSKKRKQFIYDTLSEMTGYTSPWGCMTGIRPTKIVNKLYESGMTECEARNILEDFYRVRSDKASLAIETASFQEPYLSRQAADRSRIGVYIGIPFCPTRCLYCAFPSNSIVKYQSVVDDYLSLLHKEMAAVSDYVRQAGLKVESIYLGGGTPTSLGDEQFARFMDDVTECFASGSDLCEFSLEAGRPDSINRNKLLKALSCGVTRISINPQTMNDATLEIIGRKHTSDDIKRAFAEARDAGFDNINMDIIAGLPSESMVHFTRTLDEIMLLAPEAITVHTLSVKRAADLRHSSERERLQSITVGDMVDAGNRAACDMGMKPFYMYRQKHMLGNHENAAYCRENKACVYDIHIMEEDQTILAMGVGGVSKRVEIGSITRAFNVKSIEEYMNRADEMVQRKFDLMRGEVG